MLINMGVHLSQLSKYICKLKKNMTKWTKSSLERNVLRSRTGKQLIFTGD